MSCPVAQASNSIYNMAVVRFFANAREAAGVSEVEISGATIEEVLDRAVEAYGADFARVLAISKVWRNGEPANRLEDVMSSDEIAILPPVSGGA